METDTFTNPLPGIGKNLQQIEPDMVSKQDDGLIAALWSTPAGSLGLLGQSTLLPILSSTGATLRLRSIDTTQRKQVRIGQRDHLVHFPLTFTPYASAKPCSARCWFCSENLDSGHVGPSAAKLRPDQHYPRRLQEALKLLHPLPLGLSVSGLEMTDDLDWLTTTIGVASDWERNGGIWTDKAGYTNAAGFAEPRQRKEIISLLRDFDWQRLEVSRHHHDHAINQHIMRFRPQQAIQDRIVFEDALNAMADKLPVALISIIQSGGIETADDVHNYLRWARDHGVRRVIFRELCTVPEDYTDNRTKQLIAHRRQGIETLIADWLAHDRVPKSIVAGYYFWNATFSFHDVDVTFERSDYNQMKRCHASGEIHKLVFFANGNLCADWDPAQQIIATID